MTATNDQPDMEHMPEDGTYELIRGRLQVQQQDLQERLNRLNEARIAVFGSIETKLLANKRLQTTGSGIARDLVTIGAYTILGYNVDASLRTGIHLQDVMAVFRYDGNEFVAQQPEWIADPAFTTDFTNLYTYYKETRFHQFFLAGNYLYMVFQLSDRATDIKTFKWLVKDETLSYQDNRSDQEYRFPPAYDFAWAGTTREQQRYGKHPHIAILDQVFVETIGGDLTIKIENNTDDAKGIFSEPVDYPDQTLDDGQYRYAELNNLVVLEIKPFQEKPRFFVYDRKERTVQKIEALRYAGILLPDQQGLIFSTGYYLQTGACKLFEHGLTEAVFQQRMAAPNGEDFIYVFFEKTAGKYVLLQYNLISQSVKTPVICKGFTLLAGGELCYFTEAAEASTSHVVQVWQTPFLRSEQPAGPSPDSLIYKIGNRDLVKAMAECRNIITLLNKEDQYAGLYHDLVRQSRNLLDTYYWITEEATFGISTPLQAIQSTAHAAIDEYEKVVQLKEQAQQQTTDTAAKAATLFSGIKHASFQSIHDFVESLTGLRRLRGEVIGLKTVRYIDPAFINQLETDLAQQTDHLSQHCVSFLLEERALEPYQQQIAAKQQAIEAFTKAIDGRQLEKAVNGIAAELELLIDIVSNLKIEDTTQSTRIIDRISLLFASLNQLKAAIRNKVQTLGAAEARADFAAQLKLADQSVANALDLAGTPEKADELLNKAVVQLEDLESRFAAFDEFTAVILSKREEVIAAFEARRNSLTEARNKKALALEAVADRILKGIAKKAAGLTTPAEINGYFAADLMVSKVRDTITRLQELADTARAETIETRLKTAQEDALRKLKDKQELFESGEQIIRLGRHRFLVNKQPLDLGIVSKDDRLYFHLNGTDFYQAVQDAELLALQTYGKQELVSENEQVYRSAYLAYRLFIQPSAPPLHLLDPAALLQLVKQEAARNYTEGYTKGVHDEDAFRILQTLVAQHQHLGLLRYPPAARAIARFFWNSLPEAEGQSWNRKIKAGGELLRTFPDSREHLQLVAELETAIRLYAEQLRLPLVAAAGIPQAAAYLFYQRQTADLFCSSRQAMTLLEQLEAALNSKDALPAFRNAIAGTENHAEKIRLAVQWATAFISSLKDVHQQGYILEVAALCLYRHEPPGLVISEEPVQSIAQLAGTHPTIQQGKYLFRYHAFLRQLEQFTTVEVPAYENFRRLKQERLATRKAELRLHELEPQVLTSFVRNKLIDQVYLELLGDNLAKQLGTAGGDKRTDRNGMLLLISPPGYGKTTLMEYIANRLGLIFMKINGPAIGHEVTAVDPATADNAAARQELKKLNLALEMGNNVMLYLDDIQHCSPVFLQKFISLADGTRKMEGVYDNQPKTYDLKGKRFCVVMAGNPYTESGEQFKVPDMLANRSDTYNLGDIIGSHEALFRLSMIENALTSNPVLNQLAAKSRTDLYQCIKAVETGNREGWQPEARHTRQEMDTYFAVLGKVVVLRDRLLKVNETYIRSAAMDDAYRTEPPFKLQGSYRDMNKLMSKIVPIMNDEELQLLLLAHYRNESQTLTQAAEANLLKYKELSGTLTGAEAERWQTIRATFVQNNQARRSGNEQAVSQLVAQMQEFTLQVEGIRRALEKGTPPGR